MTLPALPASVMQQELPVIPVRDTRRKGEWSLGGEITRGGGAVWQTGRTFCVTKGPAARTVGGGNVSAVGEEPS